MELTDLLEHIPQLPQRQDSTAEQIEDLLRVAQRIGCYDAADILKTIASMGVEDSDMKMASELPGVLLAISEGKKILAIKEVRSAFNWSLSRAKEAIDRLAVRGKGGIGA